MFRFSRLKESQVIRQQIYIPAKEDPAVARKKRKKKSLLYIYNTTTIYDFLAESPFGLRLETRSQLEQQRSLYSLLL